MNAGTRWQRFLDARMLLWALAGVLLTGLPLYFWFEGRADVHADRLPDPVGTWLRGLHAAFTLLLVAGVLVHFIGRLRDPARRKGLRSGAWTLFAVAVATVTGALAAQTGASAYILERLGTTQWDGTTSPVALLHVGLVTILVAVLVLVHVPAASRSNWLRSPWQGVAVLVAAVAVLLVFGSSRPGDPSLWRGPTSLLAPPLPGLWAWTLLVGALAVAVAAWTAARRGAA